MKWLPHVQNKVLMRWLAWIIWAVTPSGYSSPAAIEVLGVFNGPNGANSYAGLCLASDGNFYGTTHQGGANGLPVGLGTVFRLTPQGDLTTLVSFGPAPNGTKPYASLVQADDGYLYGTTFQGGPADAGTIFRITTNGNFGTLLSFTILNGARPSGRLLASADGWLYGTTQSGGTAGKGTIFRVTTNGELATLVAFDGTNGSGPYAELIQTPDGRLFGTTVTGGNSNLGTVFQLTTNGELTTLASFTGENGANPLGGVVADTTGNLYGTTLNGGGPGLGTIFRLATNGVLTTLHSFAGGLDGSYPRASLMFGRDGRLYGTTTLGGEVAGGGGWGIIFQITTNGELARLASFENTASGILSYGALVQDGMGDIFGTTFSQGPGLKGTVFRLRPAPPILTAKAASRDTLHIEWRTWPGLAYQLQYRTNLTQADWGVLVAETNAMLDHIRVPDTTSVDPRRLYQVIRLTSP